MKNDIRLFNAITILSFAVIIFATTFLIGLSINIINTEFSFSLLRISFINSFFISFGAVLNIFIVTRLYNKMNSVFLFLLSFGLIAGICIAGLFSSFIFSSFIFIFESRTIYLYFVTNIIFILTISIMSTGFILYQGRIRLMERIIAEEKTLRERAEKELYSSKINPHFLFNSLNLILSLLHDPPKAEKALLSLSELLRYNLDVYGRDRIAINDEIEIIKKYLYIQKLRFGNRLEYEINCSIEASIPPLILQPLVENSVKHNIDRVKKLVIQIDVHIEQKMLCINIFDSCRLLDYNMIGKGIGLENAKRRVELSGGEFVISDGGVRIKYKL